MGRPRPSNGGVTIRAKEGQSVEISFLNNYSKSNELIHVIEENDQIKITFASEENDYSDEENAK